MRLIYLITVFIFGLLPSNAQDILRIRAVIDTLCSTTHNGRGYVGRGDNIAASFIQRQYAQIGLKPFKQDFGQRFSFSVNTFPYPIIFKADNKKLALSDDYLPDAACVSIKGKFSLFFLDSSWINPTTSQINSLTRISLKKTALVSTGYRFEQLTKHWPPALAIHISKARLRIILTKTRPVGSLSQTQSPLPALVYVRAADLPPTTKHIRVDIKNLFVDTHIAQNIMGYLPGTARPDSFIVFTAHYDHLGSIGNAVFAGANDNASGVAMMLELARHYTQPQNRSRYSMAFIAFAGEEIGLLGSFFYTRNPLFPLSHIRFLINLDLMGSGENGLTVVNATACPTEFDYLQKINKSRNLFASLAARGPAPNSDHYPFAALYVPAFFFYLRGSSTAYHDIHDLPATLTLAGVLPVMQLIFGFAKYVSR